MKSVFLPHLGAMQVAIKTKREIRAHPSFGQCDEDDEWWYWNRVWHSEVALSEWLIHEFYPDKLVGHTVLELGCGTGLAGVVAAKLGGIPTFSDKIPVVMDMVKETCERNGVVDYQTILLDWSHPGIVCDSYDFVLGSEIFYDLEFLEDLCKLVNRVLKRGGRGIFCDPNRLGLDMVQNGFSRYFQFNVTPRTVVWPRGSEVRSKNTKDVYVYQVTRKRESDQEGATQ